MPFVIALPIAKATNTQISVTYHGGNAAKFLKSHFRWIVPLLKRVDFIIVPSYFLDSIFQEYGIQCEVVPVIGKFEHFHNNPRNKIAPILVSNRYLEPLYDVETVIRAFQIVQEAIPSAHLIIAGNGSQSRALVDYCSQNKLNVDFRGEVTFEDMPDVLDEADIYLNPAKADNMPMSVLEAFYSGLLVISTPVGELPHLISHGNLGYFYITGDEESLAKTILYAIRHQAQSVKCAQNAFSLAGNYTWPQLRNKYLKLFNNYLKKKRIMDKESIPRIVADQKQTMKKT
jgi:glycosyltransferase involved in cell wall biosynthesis